MKPEVINIQDRRPSVSQCESGIPEKAIVVNISNESASVIRDELSSVSKKTFTLIQSGVVRRSFPAFLARLDEESQGFRTLNQKRAYRFGALLYLHAADIDDNDLVAQSDTIISIQSTMRRPRIILPIVFRGDTDFEELFDRLKQGLSNRSRDAFDRGFSDAVVTLALTRPNQLRSQVDSKSEA